MKPETITVNIYTRPASNVPERLVAVCQSADGELPISSQAFRANECVLSEVLLPSKIVSRDGVAVDNHVSVKDTDSTERSGWRFPGYIDSSGEAHIFSDPVLSSCRLEVIATYLDRKPYINSDATHGAATYSLVFSAVGKSTYKNEPVIAIEGISRFSTAVAFMYRHTGSTLETIRAAALGGVGQARLVGDGGGVGTVSCHLNEAIVPGVEVGLQNHEPSEIERLTNVARDVFESAIRTPDNTEQMMGVIDNFHAILKRSGR